MTKRRGVVALVFIGLVLVLFGAVQVMVGLRESGLRGRGGLTSKELGELGEMFGATAVQETEGISDAPGPRSLPPEGVSSDKGSAIAPGSSSGKPSGVTPTAVADRKPVRLETVISPETFMRDHMHAGKRSGLDVIRDKTLIRVNKAFCTGFSLVGMKRYEADFDREVAGAKLRLGEFDDARVYMHKALLGTTDAETAALCASHLSYLVDDPEIAAQLLEIACQTDREPFLHRAAELCRATGSQRLAEHYEARLNIMRSKREANAVSKK